MTQQHHKSYMKLTGVLVALFGPIFFLATMLPLSEPARWSLDLLSFPLDGEQTYNDPTTRFLSALAGGFLMGWGVLIWCLAHHVYDAAPDATRKAVLTSLLAWFCLDSLGSITSGNWSNALFNVLVLLILVGPLWRPASLEDTHVTS